MADNSQTITLTKDKETKNTVRFVAKEGAITGSLYVEKTDARATEDTLTVTV